MIVNGKAIDDTTGAPIPGATVSLLTGNINLKSIAADDNGNFSIASDGPADNLLITSVGYQPTSFVLPAYINKTVFPLAIANSTEPTVIVTFKPKNQSSFLWFLLLAGGYAYYYNKYKPKRK
jgi:hypothetical protein